MPGATCSNRPIYPETGDRYPFQYDTFRTTPWNRRFHSSSPFPYCRSVDLTSGCPLWPIRDGIPTNYPTLDRNIKCDVAILGGGITGAFVADALCAQGSSISACAACLPTGPQL